MRFRSVATWCLVMLAVVVPALLFGQDTTAAPMPGVEPSGLCAFIAQYQMSLVQGLSAALLWLLAQAWSGFAAAGDWIKRGTAFLAGTVLAFVLGKIGCVVDPGVGAIVSAGLSGFIAAFVNWLMFKIVKSQPNTQPNP